MCSCIATTSFIRAAHSLDPSGYPMVTLTPCGQSGRPLSTGISMLSSARTTAKSIASLTSCGFTSCWSIFACPVAEGISHTWMRGTPPSSCGMKLWLNLETLSPMKWEQPFALSVMKGPE